MLGRDGFVPRTIAWSHPSPGHLGERVVQGVQGLWLQGLTLLCVPGPCAEPCNADSTVPRVQGAGLLGAMDTGASLRCWLPHYSWHPRDVGPLSIHPPGATRFVKALGMDAEPVTPSHRDPKMLLPTRCVGGGMGGGADSHGEGEAIIPAERRVLSHSPNPRSLG